jgi:hypothetical protein
MQPLHQRMFDIHALARSRGHAFGSNPPIAGFRSEDHKSFGAVLRDDADGRFGFMCMRRRVDGVWTQIEEDGGLREQVSATAALGRAMRDGAPLERLPSGVRARPPLHQLGPRGSSAVFDLLRHRDRGAAAWTLNQAYLAMPDPDPNWATDCQTSNFHTRLFEAYLLACFREQGRLVLQGHPSPDFQILNLAGKSAWIEAVTANAEAYDHASSKPILAPRDTVERQIGSAAARFAKTLRSKLQRRYDQMEHVAGFPFAIALADFHAPGSMTWSREALPAYLYGQHAVIEERDGIRVAAARPNLALLGPEAIPAGLFRDPANCGLAAVLFSNAATIAKFNRMGFLAGMRPEGVSITRTGLLFDRTPEALEPVDFILDISCPAYAALWPETGETWSLELEVYHNPLARHPMPFELLPGCTHWFERGGEIVCTAVHERTVLASISIIRSGLSISQIDENAAGLADT